MTVALVAGIAIYYLTVTFYSVSRADCPHVKFYHVHII